MKDKDAAGLLDKVQITVNKNLVPFDPQPATVTSGVRIGTPAVTSRGVKEKEMDRIAQLIERAIAGRADAAALEKVRADVQKLTDEFPIYQDL